jgi:hypothetical protein
LLALAPDPATGKPDPAKMKAFLASYPETAKAMQLIGNRAISSGFDNSLEPRSIADPQKVFPVANFGLNRNPRL